MRRYYLAILPLLTTLCWAGPTLAESPLTDYQPLNVQQLLTTHLCPGCDLAEADLSGAHLIGADLRGADLSGADLSWVNLEGADLTQANLTGANLTGAFLTNATLIDVDLDNANLSQAQLYFVDVTGASMDNLNLAGATIVGTPISIGNGVDLEAEEQPMINPLEVWQLDLPSNVRPLPSERIDVPEPGLPSLHRHRGPSGGPCHPRFSC